MTNPLVSIIVPCYKQAHFLNDSLQSVLNQSYFNWECIIVNDGSPDNTGEIAQKWLVKDSRFKYIYQENKGVSSARNLGLDSALGEFIQFLDSDDILEDDKIMLSLNSLQNNNYDLIVTNFKTFSTDTSHAIEHPNFLKSNFLNFESILYKWGLNFNIPIHCGLFLASFFEDFRFSKDLKGNEDWMMWLCFFKKTTTVCFIDKPLVYYRSHEHSATKNVSIMNDSYIEVLKSMRNVLSEKEHVHFLMFLLSEKNEVIIKLERQINNYKISRGYKILKKIKENSFIKICFKIKKMIMP